MERIVWNTAAFLDFEVVRHLLVLPKVMDNSDFIHAYVMTQSFQSTEEFYVVPFSVLYSIHSPLFSTNSATESEGGEKVPVKLMLYISDTFLHIKIL